MRRGFDRKVIKDTRNSPTDTVDKRHMNFFFGGGGGTHSVKGYHYSPESGSCGHIF